MRVEKVSVITMLNRFPVFVSSKAQGCWQQRALMAHWMVARAVCFIFPLYDSFWHRYDNHVQWLLHHSPYRDDRALIALSRRSILN